MKDDDIIFTSGNRIRIATGLNLYFYGQEINSITDNKQIIKHCVLANYTCVRKCGM
jgi:hypothetical protein